MALPPLPLTPPSPHKRGEGVQTLRHSAFSPLGGEKAPGRADEGQTAASHASFVMVGLTRPSTAPDGAWVLGSSPRMTKVEGGGWQTTVDAGGWGRLSMGG